MSGLVIGDASVAGAHIRIEDGTSGLNTVTSQALYLTNVDYATVDNVDLSYSLISRAGEGIRADSNSDYLTIRNSNLTNRSSGIIVTSGRDLNITNNNLTNNSQAISASNVTRDQQAAAVLASGNLFANSTNVFSLTNITGTSAGLTIGASGANIVLDAASGNLFASSTNGICLNNLPSQFIGVSGTGFIIDNATAGLQTVSGIALQVSNLDNSTINGLDVSWAVNSTHTGTGIYSDANSDNITITGVTASNRVEGVRIDGGSSRNINNSTFSNNTTGVISNSVTTSSLINNNIIQANTTGLQAQAGGTQVNATNNFWGSAAGPGAGGAITASLITPMPRRSWRVPPAVPAYPPAPPSLVSGPPTVLTVTSNTDVNDGTTTSIATLLADRGADGVISLREAMIAANNTVGVDTILFAIGSGVQTIKLSSVLPISTDALIINGASQAGFSGSPVITLDAYGLSGNILEASNSTLTLSALTVTNYAGQAVRLSNADDSSLTNRIEGNTTALAYATHGGPTPPSIMLNATGNYWGPGGGPGVGGNNNVSGTPIDTTGFLSSVPAVLYRDYGDDPIAFGFASRLIDFGARHIASGPILGTNRDSEADTIPITMSSTDDTTSTPDDEDAVFGVNAFDTVNGGIAASFASGLLIVNAGDMTNYSTETVVINKAGLIVKFQEGASTIGSLDDTVTDATLQLAGITLLAGQNNSSTQFDSPITATGGLTRTGTGTLTLTGANADTGPTTVVAGTLAGGGHRPRPRSQPVSPGQRQRRSDRFAYRRSAAGGHYGPHSGRHA